MRARTNSGPRTQHEDSDQQIVSIGGKGIVTEQDLKRFNAATRRVYALMKDGKWHSSDSIISASKQREGLRRMRELRRIGKVDRLRRGNNFYYRFTHAS